MFHPMRRIPPIHTAFTYWQCTFHPFHLPRQRWNPIITTFSTYCDLTSLRQITAKESNEQLRTTSISSISHAKILLPSDIIWGVDQRFHLDLFKIFCVFTPHFRRKVWFDRDTEFDDGVWGIMQQCHSNSEVWRIGRGALLLAGKDRWRISVDVLDFNWYLDEWVSEFGLCILLEFRGML